MMGKIIAYIKKLIKNLILIFKVDWIDSIRINSLLPFEQKIKFPILLFKSELKIKNGKVIIDVEKDKIKFGMLKLGLRHSVNVMSHRGICIWLNNGNLIFKGAGLIGNGSSIQLMGGGDCFREELWNNRQF